MDFDLDDDERALQAGIRELVRGRFPVAKVREGFDPAGWRELAEAGVFALRWDESLGGLGLGTSHAVVVFEELGRALVPGPLVGQHLAAGTVDGAADGSRVIGLCLDPEASPLLLADVDSCDAILVLAEDRVSLVQVDDLDATPVARPLDPLTPLHRVATMPEGEELGGRFLATRWRRDAVVLTAALQLGLALEAAERATQYAKQRHQFDKPIGAFQAVKHLCADMRVRAEVARAAVYAAAVTVDDPTVGDADTAIAVAKIQADRAAFANGKACVHVHGGMGFTWEVDAHLFLKRAAVLATYGGRADDHAEALASALGTSTG